MGRRTVKLSGPGSNRDLEARITDLVVHYASELRKEGQNMRSCLREHNSKEMVTLIKRRNMDLQRTKDDVLRQHVNKAYELIINEEREEEDRLDDEENEERDDLVDVKDTNQMNKSVVGLWNVQPANTDSARTTDTEENGAKKREREDATTQEPEEKGKRKTKKQKGKKGTSLNMRVLNMALLT